MSEGSEFRTARSKALHIHYSAWWSFLEALFNICVTPRKSTLVRESAPERYLDEGAICCQHEILGHIDAPPHQPAMWRSSSAASKRAGKVACGKPALSSNLFE